VFAELELHVGEEVVVRHVWYGRGDKTKSVLRSVKPYRGVDLEDSWIPFIGYGCAIRAIHSSDGGMIYFNDCIPSDYDARSPEQIDQYKRLGFGEDVAREHREEDLAAKRERDEETAKLDKEAKAKGPEFIEAGKELVKDELVEEWVAYAKKNTDDAYSACVIEASIKIMSALNEGKMSEEADKAADGLGITGFQAGCVAQTIIKYHARGEEYKVYWNGLYGQPEAEGVVNPAVMTIGGSG